MSQEILQFADVGFAHDRTEAKEEWLTPRYIVDALGQFDLDPCAPVNRPWETAKQYYTIFDNGLIRPWNGRVWLNPPYGDETPRWMQRMATHKGGGVALIFVRTETGTFFPWIWDYAHSFLFLDQRIAFYEFTCATCGQGESKHKSKKNKCDHLFKSAAPQVVKGGSAGCPSMLIAYSSEDGEILQKCASTGKVGGKFLMNQKATA